MAKLLQLAVKGGRRLASRSLYEEQTVERVAIIGGGPAGLAVGQALAKQRIKFLLFEAGRTLAERKHDVADHLGSGIGGAGLFSDGKFSFFPSGTHLYTLEGRCRLEDAYGAIERQLAEVGIPAPPFDPDTETSFLGTGHPMICKDYPSTYGSLAQRNALIAAMMHEFSNLILANTRVEVIIPSPQGYLVQSRGADGDLREEFFTHLAIATGRFGPQALRSMMTAPIAMTDLRYEFGIRIEHPNGVGFLKAVKRPDVKYILDAACTEVRTFCTCRDGEVWMIPYGGTAALSGRSDGPPTGYSNFGLLARFGGNNLDRGRQIWADLQQRLGSDTTATWQPLTEFLDRPSISQALEFGKADRPWFPRQKFSRGDVAALLHPELYRILAESARMLITQFPDMATPETVCIFPSVEGVGAFPTVDAALQNHSGRIWYCGDVVGRFRGLVPALVSGHYVGASIAACLRETAAEELHDVQTIAAQ
ncbi:hypothetical protein A6U98_11135 [Rhizobium sp. WYCCWR10014]|jgi:uncharacterized FAD-dependent dehydrogenase|nr:hypothetical protein A6U98_11135 [Rhizobium sp. WYCCWR10014]